MTEWTRIKDRGGIVIERKGLGISTNSRYRVFIRDAAEELRPVQKGKVFDTYTRACRSGEDAVDKVRRNPDAEI